MSNTGMSRRAMLKGATLALAGAVLSACGATPTPTPAPIATKAPAAATVVPQPAAPTATTAAAAPTATKAPAATAAPVPTPAPAGVTKLIIAPWYAPTGGIPYGGNEIQVAVEKQLNVKIEWWYFERSTAREQLQTHVAGGQIPDMYAVEDVNVRNTLYDAGVAAEVPFDVIAKNAPRVFAAANKYNVLSWLGGYYKGKNWGKPNMWPHQVKPLCNGWRTDALDKVGFSGKLPATIDEFEDALTKMSAQKLFAYPFANRYGDWPSGCFNTFYLAYGAARTHWLEKDDKSGVIYGIATDGAKEAATTLARWYKKGLINPESVTMKFGDLSSAWCKGSVGYIDAAGVWYLVSGGDFDCLESRGKWARAYPPKGPNGKWGYTGFGYAVTPINFGNTVIKAPEKLAKLLQMHDLLDSDPTWAVYIANGKEGRDFTRNEVGQAVRNKEVDQNKALQIGIGGFHVFYPNYDLYPIVYGRKDFDEIEEPAMAGNMNNILTELPAFIDPAASKQATEMNPTMYKWEWDFISGAKSLDKWPDFIKEWNDKGGKVMTDAANTAYKSYATQLDGIKNSIKAAGGQV